MVTCSKCKKEVEYKNGLTRCPLCLSDNPYWPLVAALSSPSSYPKHCAIFTSLPISEIDEQWVMMVLCICIGTVLGMKNRKDIETLFLKMKAEGFNILEAVTDVPQADIMSGRCDDQIKASIDLVSRSESFSCIPVIMLEPIKHRGMLRFLFYLKLDKSETRTEDIIDPFIT